MAIFQGIWDGIVAIFTPLGEWFSERWNDITTVLADVAKWFGDMFQKAWNALTNIFSSIGTWFGERWNDVTTALTLLRGSAISSRLHLKRSRTLLARLEVSSVVFGPRSKTSS